MNRWKKWEESEDELLTSLYAEGKSWEYNSLRIPRHTPKACEARKASHLEPLRVSWTVKEDERFLSLQSAVRDLKYIAKQLSPSQ